MNRLVRILIIFGIGGFSYGLIEILFRGYTHWSMFLAGGLIFSILYKLFGYIGKGRLLIKCVMGCAIITTVEFITGVGVNIFLELSVWDYSHKPLNLFGQICLLFSIGWFFISIPVSLLTDRIRTHLRFISQ